MNNLYHSSQSGGGPPGPRGPKGDTGDRGPGVIRLARGVGQCRAPTWRMMLCRKMGPPTSASRTTPAPNHRLGTGAFCGQKGDQGSQGQKGDKGDTGDTGGRGDRGPQGVPGERGLQGNPGSQGIKGDKGDKGDRGDPGITLEGQLGRDHGLRCTRCRTARRRGLHRLGCEHEFRTAFRPLGAACRPGCGGRAWSPGQPGRLRPGVEGRVEQHHGISPQRCRRVQRFLLRGSGREQQSDAARGLLESDRLQGSGWKWRRQQHQLARRVVQHNCLSANDLVSDNGNLYIAAKPTRTKSLPVPRIGMRWRMLPRTAR